MWMDKRQQLESLIDKTLREQPPRRAPADLESNVLAMIEQQLSRAWWQSGFVRWPVAARVGFALLSIGLVKFAIILGVWVGGGFKSVASLFSEATDWIHPLAHTVTSITDRIPAIWLYGGLVAICSAYVMLFGVGMAAYRTMYGTR
jgi:hypothetical protein